MMWKIEPLLPRAQGSKGQKTVALSAQSGHLPARSRGFLLAAALSIILFATACAEKKVEKGPAKHYELTGKVLSVNTKDQTASIDAAAIPNYMEAMTMNYPIAAKSEFESLHPGDQIRATVNVYDSGDFDLSSIHKTTK